MLIEVLLIIVSLGLLLVGAEGLVRGSASLALRAGISPLVVGLTVVAFGTSAPEMVVSIKSALAGQGDLAVGNVVGSNIFNIAVILGLTALLCPIPVNARLIKAEVPLMIGVALLVPLILLNHYISRLEGALLFTGVIVYTVASVLIAPKRAEPAVQAEFAAGIPRPTRSWLIDLLFIVGGLGVLVLGSQLLVDNAAALAQAVGISEAVIALTIIAAGTSMPELATSLVAALRREPDIAVGNVVGSNIFNVLGILGPAALIRPIAAAGIRPLDTIAMIVVSIALLPILWSNLTVRRTEGALLLAAYGVYLYLLWPK